MAFSKQAPVVVVDLDGVLCELGERDPYDGESCATDTQVPAIRAMLEALMDKLGWKVMFVTGRTETAIDETVRWLSRHGWSGGVGGTRRRYIGLHMREVGDYREGWEYKQGVLEVIATAYDIKLVIDDDLLICQMARRLGFDVLWAQVCPSAQERET